jgi:hypothetical protein
MENKIEEKLKNIIDDINEVVHDSLVDWVLETAENEPIAEYTWVIRQNLNPNPENYRDWDWRISGMPVSSEGEFPTLEFRRWKHQHGNPPKKLIWWECIPQKTQK